MAEALYDFRGRTLYSRRALPSSPTSRPEWSPVLGLNQQATLAGAGATRLEASGYAVNTVFDGLDRPTETTLPDGSA